MSQQQATVLRVDTGQPFIASATLVTNADGSVSFQLADGGYAGQSPDGGYGVRVDQAPNTGVPQQYQRATLNGNAVTFYPLSGYPPYVYLVGLGTVYPG